MDVKEDLVYIVLIWLGFILIVFGMNYSEKEYLITYIFIPLGIILLLIGTLFLTAHGEDII